MRLGKKYRDYIDKCNTTFADIRFHRLTNRPNNAPHWFRDLIAPSAAIQNDLPDVPIFRAPTTTVADPNFFAPPKIPRQPLRSPHAYAASVFISIGIWKSDLACKSKMETIQRRSRHEAVSKGGVRLQLLCRDRCGRLAFLASYGKYHFGRTG